MKRAEIERLLPEVFRRTLHPGNPLEALLDVMEALHAPDERILDDLDAVFDARRTPGALVPFLARWVDLEALVVAGAEERDDRPLLEFPTGDGRLRELVAAAAYLSRWRGTRKGLLRFLEVATGVHGFEVDERVTEPDGRVRPLHVRVRAPQETEPHQALIRKIIELEKPAYVTYELEFGAPPGSTGDTRAPG